MAAHRLRRRAGRQAGGRHLSRRRVRGAAAAQPAAPRGGRIGARVKVKTGHAGTLDPFATGLLLISRRSRHPSAALSAAPTEDLRVVAHLGWRSDSGDVDGELDRTGRVPDDPQLPTGELMLPVPAALRDQSRRRAALREGAAWRGFRAAGARDDRLSCATHAAPRRSRHIRARLCRRHLRAQRRSHARGCLLRSSCAAPRSAS